MKLLLHLDASRHVPVWATEKEELLRWDQQLTAEK